MALPAMWMMWKGLQTSRENIGKNFYKVVILMTITVVFMGSGRQIYRANALEPHQKLVKLRTEEFEQTRKIAIENSKNQISDDNNTDMSLAEKGKKVFNQYCAACHKPKDRLVGPPVTEMVAIYKDDVEAMKKWIKNPGKKRADMTQMPGFPQIPDEQLNELTEYILTISN